MKKILLSLVLLLSPVFSHSLDIESNPDLRFVSGVDIENYNLDNYNVVYGDYTDSDLVSTKGIYLASSEYDFVSLASDPLEFENIYNEEPDLIVKFGYSENTLTYTFSDIDSFSLPDYELATGLTLLDTTYGDVYLWGESGYIVVGGTPENSAYFEMPTDFSGNMFLTLTTSGIIILGLFGAYAGYLYILKIMKPEIADEKPTRERSSTQRGSGRRSGGYSSTSYT